MLLTKKQKRSFQVGLCVLTNIIRKGLRQSNLRLETCQEIIVPNSKLESQRLGLAMKKNGSMAAIQTRAPTVTGPYAYMG